MLPFKILDHEADIGLEAYGATLQDSFINAAHGMFSILFSESGKAAAMQPSKRFRVEIEAESPEELLIAWLNQLLFLHDSEKIILTEFKITHFSDKKLTADVAGQPLDLERHPLETYIKAATYHQVSVKQEDAWRVRVIFDV